MQDLSDKTAYDVVVRLPKTLPPATTVAQARAALADDHVHLLLVTDGGRLLGTLGRADLPGSEADDQPVLAHTVLEGRTIGPDVSALEAMDLIRTHGQRRLAVVDERGRLLGLLCLKRRLDGFCSDADVAARAADPRSGPS